jgi:nitrite reductase (NADH) small subunit/3-phenylpropionate/trans-cinnamate dioxygenase ferredoxin subunit
MMKVSTIGQVPPGTGKVVQAAGKTIALFNVDGTFYALDNACTHRGGPLGEGRLAGTVVACPWHGNQFDVTTGQVITGTQSVRAYAVHIQGDDILLDLS